MWRYPRTWLPIVAVLFWLMPGGPGLCAQPQSSVGRVTGLVGSATVLSTDRFQPRALALQNPLYQQDVIQTEATSRLRLTFRDETVITLGEESRLEITSYLYSPRQKTRTSLLTFPVGVFRAIVKQVLPHSTFEVATATAVAAIRGTDWMGEVRPDATAIVVLQGEVAVSNPRSAMAGTVTLTPGMGTTVRVDQAPTTPTQWGGARVDALRQATSLP